jgi:hypothetical protein
MGIFDAEALQLAIDAELNTIPAAHTSCLVGYYTTSGVWRVCVVKKAGDHWLFGATLEGDRTAGKIQGGLMVRASW